MALLFRKLLQSFCHYTGLNRDGLVKGIKLNNAIHLLKADHDFAS